MIIKKFKSLSTLGKTITLILTILTAIVIFVAVSFTWMAHLSKYHFGTVQIITNDKISITTKFGKNKIFNITPETKIKPKNSLEVLVGENVFISSESKRLNQIQTAKIIWKLKTK